MIRKVHEPRGPRKSIIPEEVLIPVHSNKIKKLLNLDCCMSKPAPVNATT